MQTGFNLKQVLENIPMERILSPVFRRNILRVEKISLIACQQCALYKSGCQQFGKIERPAGDGAHQQIGKRLVLLFIADHAGRQEQDGERGDN